MSKILKVVALVLMGTLGAMSAETFLSWSEDRRVLREVALAQTTAYGSISQRVRALNSYVYRNKGFAKNRGHFLFPHLGPTPIQVLEQGGDCADKSRLLAALLAEIDVDSTLAMLYPCEHCPAGHTVVEARFDEDAIALDPVYDLDFPDPNGGYLGLQELSQNHRAVVERILELRAERGTADKVNGYDYEQHSYRHIRTVNWKKNVVTRFVGHVLDFLGYDAFLVRRPPVLEDPKLLLTVLSAGLAGLFGAVAMILWWFDVATRKRRED